MNYKDLDPKNLAETPKLVPTNKPPTEKKDCILDVLQNAFNQVKGAVKEIIGDVTNAFTNAINDIKAIGNAFKEIISCADLEFKLGKISIDGILDDIKNAVKNGINDAINFHKGILDAAKEARAFLTCQKGTAYEREVATYDSQLLKASDDTEASGEASTRALFTSGTNGTSTPLSPKMRRDIYNGAPAGNAFVKSQMDARATSTLDGVKSNARAECNKNNTISLQGIADSINVTNYG